MPEVNPEAGPPLSVRLLRQSLQTFLNQTDRNGNRIGSSKYGVYAFYDYDGEPIYVGQTRESLRSRISRHLTNQRTDAVAMNVLDPFEVAEVEVWPIDPDPALSVPEQLNRAEYAVFQLVLANSTFGAVLNEVAIRPAPAVVLPQSFRGFIVPPEVFPLRKHPDIRIARRAATIANLARVISERDVRRPGLRLTLLTQARRLEWLARVRLEALGFDPDMQPTDLPIGDEDEDTAES